MAVRAGRWPGLPLGLVFRLLIHRVTRLTGRADGGIVGAQASGDARALRRSVGFVISLALRVLTHTTVGLSLTRRVFLSGVQHAHYLDALSHHLVDHDVVRVGDDFACARHAPRAIQVRMLGGWQYGRLDQPTYAAGRWRAIVGDEADDGREVGAC